MKSRLLLVACSTAVMPSLSTKLAATGHRVRFAPSGAELLKKARRRLPDLFILDASLPDEEIGTVCQALGRLPWMATVPRLLLARRAENLGCASSAFEHHPAFHFTPEKLAWQINEKLGLGNRSQFNKEGNICV